MEKKEDETPGAEVQLPFFRPNDPNPGVAIILDTRAVPKLARITKDWAKVFKNDTIIILEKKLPPHWKIQIFHGGSNEAFLKFNLADEIDAGKIILHKVKTLPAKLDKHEYSRVLYDYR